jgi:dTDP-4-amino-4,6-dideoxygalactose transaminase
MERAEAIVAERKRLAARYRDAFSSLNWLRIPSEPEGYGHGYQSYPCLFMPDVVEEGRVATVNDRRNAWMDRLQQMGIATRPATHAVHMLSFYSGKYGLSPDDFPQARAANDCSVSLPLFHGMTDNEQAYVIDHVLQGPY